MEFKYFTKFTKDNIDKYIERILNNTTFRKFTFLVYILKEDNSSNERWLEWLEHLKKADKTIVFNEEKTKEIRRFNKIESILYNENDPDFNIDKIKNYLVTNNMYYENNITV